MWLLLVWLCLSGLLALPLCRSGLLTLPSVVLAHVALLFVGLALVRLPYEALSLIACQGEGSCTNQLSQAVTVHAAHAFMSVQPCREAGSTSGEAYMSSPSLVWVTEDGNLAIGDMPNVGGYRGRRVALQPKHTLFLASSESVLEVLWKDH